MQQIKCIVYGLVAFLNFHREIKFHFIKYNFEENIAHLIKY